MIDAFDRGELASLYARVVHGSVWQLCRAMLSSFWDSLDGLHFRVHDGEAL